MNFLIKKLVTFFRKKVMHGIEKSKSNFNHE